MILKDSTDALQKILKQFLFQGIQNNQWPWPAELSTDDHMAFCESLRIHRLQPLIFDKAKQSGDWDRWPAEVKKRFEKLIYSELLMLTFRDKELAVFIRSLHDLGVRPMLLKGSALAYSHYGLPHHRPRLDSDLLIRFEDLEPTKKILRQTGYEIQNTISGEWVSSQLMASKRDAAGIAHMLDIHWQLFIHPVFRDLVTYEEMDAQCQSIDLCQEKVFVLSPALALLHALLHRVFHHQSDPDLIWVYDIYLLAKQSGVQKELYEIAKAKKVLRICLPGLRLAQEWFGLNLESCWLENLGSGPYDAWLKNPSRIKQFALNFFGIKSFRDKFVFLMENLFPREDYLRARLLDSKNILPVLYAKRIVMGIPRLFSKQKKH